MKVLGWAVAILGSLVGAAMVVWAAMWVGWSQNMQSGGWDGELTGFALGGAGVAAAAIVLGVGLARRRRWAIVVAAVAGALLAFALVASAVDAARGF